MDKLKLLADMEIGEEGYVTQVLGDAHIYHKLVYLGFDIGAHVIILSRMKAGISQVSCIAVSIGTGTVVLEESEATKILVKIKNPERISYWERPEVWRPLVWPFLPHWGFY